MKNRAVFLDRDGTINVDVGYPANYDQIDIYPYSFDAIKKIKRAGFLAVIITNQSGVGRGFIPEKNLAEIHSRLNQAFREHGVPFDAIYHCPHFIHSQEERFRKDCTCRKPGPGMGLRAAKDLDIDLGSSYMIGDKFEDVLFGLNIQAQPILVLTGYGQESLTRLQERGIRPAYVAANLLEAAEWISRREE